MKISIYQNGIYPEELINSFWQKLLFLIVRSFVRESGSRIFNNFNPDVKLRTNIYKIVKFAKYRDEFMV